MRAETTGQTEETALGRVATHSQEIENTLFEQLQVSISEIQLRQAATSASVAVEQSQACFTQVMNEFKTKIEKCVKDMRRLAIEVAEKAASDHVERRSHRPGDRPQQLLITKLAEIRLDMKPLVAGVPAGVIDRKMEPLQAGDVACQVVCEAVATPGCPSDRAEGVASEKVKSSSPDGDHDQQAAAVAAIGASAHQQQPTFTMNKEVDSALGLLMADALKKAQAQLEANNAIQNDLAELQKQSRAMAAKAEHKKDIAADVQCKLRQIERAMASE